MSLKRIPVKKGQPFLLLALLIAISVFMVMLSKCSHKPSSNAKLQTEKVKSGGDTLDVAIELSPLSYRMVGDSIIGLDYEIMSGISSIARRPVRFHPFAPLDYAIRGMEKGLFDVVISSLPITEVLRQTYNLSEKVYLDREILVQLKDSESFITSPEELAGDTVWIAAGSPFLQRVENLSDEIGEPIHIVSPEGRTAEHLIMLVARGEIPRAVVNEGLAKRMKEEKYPYLDLETPISFTQFQSWIIFDKIDPNLPDSLNNWLHRFQNTKEFQDILKRYGIQF